MNAERDPLPERDWEPASSAWARKAAIEACKAAVKAVKEARKTGPTEENDDE